ncbi:CcoQ/FixQ family Cbb3-type cytochrome c oxidase assembly chaperone [Rhodobacter ferrooxidans]|uniref:Cbb3-type cytochrome oxidase component n=1 Tax=Rhodobacter ferrooxidans TaxID=371731 RepID=C8RWM7_9RHOB|nr:CcoQ/FixQ family Cbb3-type cytochrome c oxidase assembly chaperone [Rhodobacter sp. SW2]EEW26970.1 Cbb3-type cytochrome oxidase component [Rhodobacter sp. SW2]
METYTFLRELADSWVLLVMVTFFLGVVVWAFRPGSRPVHDEVATSIFRNETRPARDPVEAKSGPQSKEAWK